MADHPARRTRKRPAAFDGAWAVVVVKLGAYTEVEGRSMRPWLAFWIDPARESGLALQTSADRAGLPLEEGYRLALAAAPVPPTRILCRDDETAARVRASVPADVPVVVDQGFPLSALAERLTMATAADLGTGQSFLASPGLHADFLVSVLATAADLRARVREAALDGPVPFKIDLEHPSIVDTTVLLTPGGALVVGEPDLDLADPAGPGDGPHGMLCFLTAADLGPAGWRLADESGWRLPGSEVAPDVFYVDRDGVMRPLASDDVVRTLACARAVTAWLGAGRPPDLTVEVDHGAGPVRARIRRVSPA